MRSQKGKSAANTPRGKSVGSQRVGSNVRDIPALTFENETQSVSTLILHIYNTPLFIRLEASLAARSSSMQYTKSTKLQSAPIEHVKCISKTVFSHLTSHASPLQTQLILMYNAQQSQLNNVSVSIEIEGRDIQHIYHCPYTYYHDTGSWRGLAKTYFSIAH